MMGDEWKDYDFSQYDIIYHVAELHMLMLAMYLMKQKKNTIR